MGPAAGGSLMWRADSIHGLVIAHDLSAARWIHIPNMWLLRKALQAQFAGLERARPAGPDHTKLRLGAVILHIQNLAGPDVRADILQDGTQAADVADTGDLHERPAIGVYAPDTHRQGGIDSRFPSSVHAPPQDRPAIE